LVNLGVKDVSKARAFYESLDWASESPDGEVVFFQAGALIISLWDRPSLASDSSVTDNGGWGGVTPVHSVDDAEPAPSIRRCM